MAILHHAPQTRLGETEHGREIGRNHGVPVLLLHAQQQHVARDRGVINEDGRHLVRALQLVHQRVYGGGVTGIEHRSAPPEPARGKVGREFFCAGGGGRGANKTRAGATQGERDGMSYAARGTGDERDVVFKHEHPPGLSAEIASQRFRQTAVPFPPAKGVTLAGYGCGHMVGCAVLTRLSRRQRRRD